MQSVTEIYATSIRPLGEGEKLELATLILEDISQLNKKKANGHKLKGTADEGSLAGLGEILVDDLEAASGEISQMFIDAIEKSGKELLQ